MSKIGFFILAFMYEIDAKSKYKAVTVNEIAERYTKIKANTIYKYVKKFVDEGYIEVGAKEIKANTYYITDAGIKKFREERDS